ncbi:ribosomal protein S12/S23 [Daedalea quercina L-15889]|uniref:Ribosomal protein S12/S23 n=1 Tax=Daedalea quercina L-15889 TaxID=1314783 RepID=A0A165TPV9_9APHY|nr:ribosomal protein S12/S23 [Daedalea quercina L-15889]
MTLNQSMRSKHPPKKRARATAPLLNNCPQRKGMAMQIFIMSPKKPNSAKRKVARVKLTNGNVVHAYINGEGNLMHDHAIVLVRGGRAQDLPGVRYKVVRGVYDHPSVVGRLTARSKYGGV